MNAILTSFQNYLKSLKNARFKDVVSCTKELENIIVALGTRRAKVNNVCLGNVDNAALEISSSFRILRSIVTRTFVWFGTRGALMILALTTCKELIYPVESLRQTFVILAFLVLSSMSITYMKENCHTSLQHSHRCE